MASGSKAAGLRVAYREISCRDGEPKAFHRKSINLTNSIRKPRRTGVTLRYCIGVMLRYCIGVMLRYCISVILRYCIGVMLRY